MPIAALETRGARQRAAHTAGQPARGEGFRPRDTCTLQSAASPFRAVSLGVRPEGPPGKCIAFPLPNGSPALAGAIKTSGLEPRPGEPSFLYVGRSQLLVPV